MQQSIIFIGSSPAETSIIRVFIKLHTAPTPSPWYFSTFRHLFSTVQNIQDFEFWKVARAGPWYCSSFFIPLKNSAYKNFYYFSFPFNGHSNQGFYTLLAAAWLSSHHSSCSLQQDSQACITWKIIFKSVRFLCGPLIWLAYFTPYSDPLVQCDITLGVIDDVLCQSLLWTEHEAQQWKKAHVWFKCVLLWSSKSGHVN